MSLSLADAQPTHPTTTSSTPNWWLGQVAEQIGNVRDVTRRAYLYLALAKMQAQVGDKQSAHMSIESFKKCVAGVEPRQVAYLYANLTVVYAKLDDEAGIQKAIAQALAAKDGQDLTYAISLWLTDAGKEEDARKLAESSKYAVGREFILGGMAEHLAKRGELAEAQRLLTEADRAAHAAAADCKKRGADKAAAEVLEDLGWHYAAVGDETKARDIAAGLPPEEDADVLVEVAKAELRSRNKAACRQTLNDARHAAARMKHDDVLYSFAMSDIQSVAIKCGEAMKVPAKGQVPDYYFQTALAKAKTGDAAGALKTIGLAEFALEREKTELGGGKTLGVIQSMRAWQNWYARIAAALVKTGHDEQAIQLAKRGPAHAQADEIYRAIAIAQAQKGDIQEAKQMVQTIADEQLKRSAVIDIAKAAARVENPQEVERLLNDLPIEARIRAELAIAKTLM